MSKSFLLLALLVVVSESQRGAAPGQRADAPERGSAPTADAGAHKSHQRG